MNIDPTPALPSLSDMRLRRTLSVKELATRSGVAASTLFAIEHGVSKPRMATIRKLVAVLDCDPRDIAWPGDPFAPLARRK